MYQLVGFLRLCLAFGILTCVAGVWGSCSVPNVVFEDVSGYPNDVNMNCTSTCNSDVLIHSRVCGLLTDGEYCQSCWNVSVENGQNDTTGRLTLTEYPSKTERNISCQNTANDTTNLAVQITECVNVDIQHYPCQLEFEINGEKMVCQCNVYLINFISCLVNVT